MSARRADRATWARIASSGTRQVPRVALKERNKAEGDAPELIGQFGVGFYSAFMVADEADGRDPSSGLSERGLALELRKGTASTRSKRPMGLGSRGTVITLHLREAEEASGR